MARPAGQYEDRRGLLTAWWVGASGLYGGSWQRGGEETVQSTGILCEKILLSVCRVAELDQRVLLVHTHTEYVCMYPTQLSTRT
jgi:hypothetical protein